MISTTINTAQVVNMIVVEDGARAHAAAGCVLCVPSSDTAGLEPWALPGDAAGREPCAPPCATAGCEPCAPPCATAGCEPSICVEGVRI